jgi:hypothetical protein
MNDDSRLYCTELVYDALRRVKPSIKLETAVFNGHRVVPVEAFSNHAEEFVPLYYAGG